MALDDLQPVDIKYMSPITKKSMWLKGLCGASMAALGLLVSLPAMALEAAGKQVGLPTDGDIGLQPSGSEIKESVTWFHDIVLMPVMVGVSLLVLVLLVWIVLRYNKRANPVAAKFSHNTAVEIIWTVGPVLILVGIAFFSFDLLGKINHMPKPDVVVKATGNQWYWTYDYPEQGVSDVESRLLPEATDLTKARAAKIPYLLEVDNALVVPVGKVVHVKVTASDVIHAFAMPAFGIKVDAMPGRLNHVWFKAEKIGNYYGQCSELCGVDHAYMPIKITVVSQADYDAFIVKNGGKTTAMIAQEAKDAALKLKAETEAASVSASASSAASTTASATTSEANSATSSTSTSAAASAQ